MKKALIIDQNGVLIKSSHLSEKFEEKYKVDEKEFMPILKQVMDEIRKPGAKHPYEYFKPYFRKWKIRINKDELLDFWVGEDKLDYSIVGMIRDLIKKGVKVMILSNDFRERAKYRRKHLAKEMILIDELIPIRYYSWQTGFTKSQKESYRLLLKEQKLKPEECVFIDDKEENVKLALELGFTANVYTGSVSLRRVLNKHSYFNID